MHTTIRTAAALLAAAALLTTAAAAQNDVGSQAYQAAMQNQQQQQNGGYAASSALGGAQPSTVQGYGGVPAAVNNQPAPVQPNANWSMPSYAYPGMPGQPGMSSPEDYYRFQNQQQLSGLPAWSQNNFYSNRTYMLPFGAQLFRGRFANTYSTSLNADYKISPGDRVLLRVWGARQYDDVLIVDQQGNIFIPEIGPLYVEGINQANLQSEIERQISHVYTSNVEVYTSLLNAQPIGVFVTGFVNSPGQYAGGTHDSVISFIDRAGGIDFERGSFRNIQVKRGGRVVASVDLYDFILNGSAPALRLQDRDVILVTEKTREVTVYGKVKHEAYFELRDHACRGADLTAMASPGNRVSHVGVSGIRDNRPFNDYLTLEDFAAFELHNGDVVDYVADRQGPSMMAQAAGAIEGASRFPIARNTRLRALLSFVEIDPEIADTAAVYIRRRSVAELQKITIDEALHRLEKSALTATSASVDEAQIRVQEAQLIQNFITRASAVMPDGIVVVSRGGVVNDILLEDGDEVIIPYVSDVVLVSGEVMMPKAVTFDARMTLDDYLSAAGGVSNRADEDYILVAKANGEVGLAEDLGIAAGDRVLVMPRFDSKNMQLAKDISQVLYQLAVATKVAVDL